MVGYSYYSITTGRQAFIWDPSHGMRSLLDVLITDYGLGSQLTGWSLTSATAISPDGRHIVGLGINPNRRFEAWLVRNLDPIPLPAAVTGHSE
ncbi:Putative extracellular repeat, HAF family (fragment) [Candidatus Nitrospira inopinata]|uniref:Putative extracellular repeat, HAF family n=1 Tax=Candidatus Nitrospira inopinata TaxID=1715989 RepID=A0A0S4KPG5_9BACT